MTIPPDSARPDAFVQEQKASGRLVVHLLNRFSVHLDGCEVPEAAFLRRKAKSVLKILALQRGHGLHREQVVEALWPGLPPGGGAAQLYKAVHQARKALLATGSGLAAENLLVLRGHELRLEAPGGVQTDVEVFVDLSRRAVLSRDAAELEQALAWYGGDLLPTDLYEEWTFEPREALREQAAALELALGEVRLTAGELPEALDAFHRTLQLDPLREAAHRGLLQVYARQGHRAALERQFMRCTEVLAQALDVLPSPETTRLYRSLLKQPPVELSATPPAAFSQRPSEAPHHNLPAQPGSFVGRRRELDWIAERLLDPECRLLTLVGPGGVGKTRLALQAAAERLEDFAGGVFWVPLAGTADPETLPSTIAEVLRVTLYPGADPRAQLLDCLGDQKVLLLLDNVEHLLAKATLIAELLGAAPQLQVLVTSRERLGLRGEWLFEVGGLDYPASPEGAEASSAVRLFLGHLRRVRPGFVPDHEDLASALRICQAVEGFPLSLELAAAQGRILSCQELAQEIASGLGVLEARLRDLPSRHRSQRAAFEPSWQSLSEAEQRAFAQLSVFRDGFRRDAAGAVARANLTVLSSLVDKSLLRRTPSGQYALHELLRQFAEEKLLAFPGAFEAARQRHAHFYSQWLAGQEVRLKGPDHQAALKDVSEEQGNIRAAWRWAAHQGDLGALERSLRAVWVFSASRGSLWEEVALFGEVLEILEAQGLSPTLPTLGRLRAGWASLSYRIALSVEVQETLQEVASLFRRTGDEDDLAFALHHLSAVRRLLGDYTGEQTLLRESVALSRAVGDAWLTAYSLNDLALSAHHLGDDPEAERLCAESLRVFGQVGDPRGRAYALSNLGVITLAMARPREARTLLLSALALARENADRWLVATCLLQLSDVAVMEDNLTEARQLARDALRLSVRERIPAVAPGALTRLAAMAAPEDAEHARGWLSLVLAHPSTSPEDAREAERLIERVEARHPTLGARTLTNHPLSAHEAATWLDVVTANLLGADDP